LKTQQSLRTNSLKVLIHPKIISLFADLHVIPNFLSFQTFFSFYFLLQNTKIFWKMLVTKPFWCPLTSFILWPQKKKRKLISQNIVFYVLH